MRYSLEKPHGDELGEGTSKYYASKLLAVKICFKICRRLSDV